MVCRSVLGLVACCALSLGACGNDDSPAREPAPAVKIGMLVPGDLYPSWSLELADAARLAVEEINRAGGMEAGKRLELLLYDYDDAESAAAALQILARDDEIIGLVGPTGVTSTIACLTTVRERGWPLINPASTALALSELEDDDYLFRNAPREEAQGAVLAHYLTTPRQNAPQGLAKRVALLQLDTRYGDRLAEGFREALSDATELVFDASYPTNAEATVLSELVADVLATGPDAIFLASDGPDGRALINLLGQALEDSDAEPRVVVPEQLASDRSLAPHTLNANFVKLFATRPSSVDTPFRQAFERAFGKRDRAPDPFSGYAYDAIYLLAYAHLVHASYDLDMRQALREVSQGGTKVLLGEFARGKQLILGGTNIDYDGSGGGIAFDDNGDATTGYYDLLESTTSVSTAGSSWTFRAKERLTF